MKNLNFGVIGNCRSAALVSETGSIEWCCLPDFDSPSVFAKVLDREIGGEFSIEVDESYSTNQKYFYRTNVLCTEFISEQGCFEVIDFMPRYKTSDTEYFCPAEIYRYIRLKWGTPVFRVNYRPALNYARSTVAHGIGDRHIRSFSEEDHSDCLFLYSSLELEDILQGNPVDLREPQFLLLSYNQKIIPIDINRVYLEYQRTKVYWLNWTNRSKIYSEYNDQIIRSLLVLKIMSFQSSGAVLAALTTSIPETLGEVRNWDYRFCWLRDASMSIDTLLRTGHYSAAHRFLSYIKRILKTKHDTFQIMYGIRGERELEEIDLPHLSGYENSKPVRVGNAAFTQRQNDVFGYLLNVIYQYYQFFPGTLDEIEDMWEIVRNISRTVAKQWSKPDRGIWEIRKEEKHFVFSKVMSWVAMDRAAKIARLLNKPEYEERWSCIACKIREDVLLHGWNDELKTFTQTYDNHHVDASLLLLAEYEFISPDNEMYRSTVSAVKKSLFHKGLMYRYVAEDGFGKPSSSFTICTFWLIQALYRTGSRNEARKIFNNMLSYGNHVGLFSEDIDFNTKRLLGNFPQAYSHFALINTAILLSGEVSGSKFLKP
jgi:GH15 family glucan-1,4-alpha-glucosidase